MALQKLPNDIQSLFCASTQINSYKRAIEELVYNSLDAESTSIAIRVNIEQNTIQVIDNGCGVSSTNFNLIGQRHATSKCVDLKTLKSVINKYGYRGQSLSSIIEVSQSVKITSRCADSKETWVKSFYKGKQQKIFQTTERPSKGTTIDIKGFLYNQRIQKKAVDSLNELNEIKIFLEQLSLVHNNISLSLRDDAKNEIIFKLHKNRDIYQTLDSMFGINNKDVQEFRVEKHPYKLIAFIGKEGKDVSQKHWIYLNGKLIRNNSKIQKIFDDNFVKSLKLNFRNKRKVKAKNAINQEDAISRTEIPFYFIFITCPYYDYDISYTSKEIVVEFKDWQHVNKLIEKMVKFYAGDLNLKEIKPGKGPVINQQKTRDTRDQVKLIMDKILGSNQRKIGISQMQNGIKGKITKRKHKQKVEKIPLTKLLSNENTSNKCKNINLEIKTKKANEPSSKQSELKNINPDEANNPDDRSKVSIKMRSKPKYQNKFEIKKQDVNRTKQKNVHVKKTIEKAKNKNGLILKDNKTEFSSKVTKDEKTANNTNKRIETKKDKTKRKNVMRKLKYKDKIKKNNVRKPKAKLNPVLKIFHDPTDSVKKRCDILTKKVNDLLSYKKKRKRTIFINETIHYSSIIKNNKNYAIRKKIDEIVIHDYIPKPPSLCFSPNCGQVIPNYETNNCKSSYDLVQTILKTQETKNSYSDSIEHPANVSSEKLDNKEKDNTFTQMHEMISDADFVNQNDAISSLVIPRLTYESHNYGKRFESNRFSHNYDRIHHNGERIPENNARFITTQSKKNFAVPSTRLFDRKKYNSAFKKNLSYKIKKYQMFTNVDNLDQSSYTIDFSESNRNVTLSERAVEYQDTIRQSSSETPIGNSTYTIERNYGCTYSIEDRSSYFNETPEAGVDFIENSNEEVKHNDEILSMNDLLEHQAYKDKNITGERNIDVVFVSKSQERFKDETLFDKEINPLNVCETVHSQDEDDHRIDQRIWNDSLFNDELDIYSILCDRNAYTPNQIDVPMETDNMVDVASHSVSDPQYYGIDVKEPPHQTHKNHNQDDIEIIHSKSKNTVIEDASNNYLLSEKNQANSDLRDEDNFKNFNLKNRLRFVPKGMSPIFTNNQTKNAYNYDCDFEEDYYEDIIYDKFANNVQSNVEIFEPVVQNVKELATKAIEKVNTKLNKDNASLIFNAESLKQAQVLRQIDCKFIAAKIEGRTQQSSENAAYLVLFDQHAVHERIRLENNLSDYFERNQWKSIPLDDITLKLSRDEILYLHNYKDKFNQLGLQWTVLGHGDVLINAIPEAILGKNPRQVDIVIKAVKNLIVEEINAIKSQSGCISLYPKSIMDLVFSEACRHAIKFGDQLSTNDCVDLLNSLSKCKTPFQCAHGRPVMAVLLDIKQDMRRYKVNIANILKWTKSRKK